LFYTAGLDIVSLLAAGAVCGVLFGIGRFGVRAPWVYLLGGAVLWALVLRSGVHPTLAGVALAFVMPMDDTGQRIEHGLGGWITWIVLPLFGLVNVGLRLDAVTLVDFATPVMLGTTLGLVVGKPAGVFGATWIAVRLGFARLPAGLGWAQLFGVGVLCGIGFTMSLFIGELGFHGSPIQAEVKLAVFTGSLIAAALGVAVLTLTSRGKRQD
jgi:NhaA family Na+:H+ antiporter